MTIKKDIHNEWRNMVTGEIITFCSISLQRINGHAQSIWATIKHEYYFSCKSVDVVDEYIFFPIQIWT